MNTQAHTPTQFVDVADTAKLIRTALREAFPTVKFSVRSSRYAGGSSIRVGWTDGPTEKQVGAITSRFQGASFDGMIDLKSSVYVEFDGQRTRFGGDFVFVNRQHSRAFVERYAGRLAARYGLRDDQWSIRGSDSFGYHMEVDPSAGRWAQVETGNRIASYAEVSAGRSPTAERIAHA